jgi:hypothetical protein
MNSYKNPSFQDRIGRAAEAKRKALEGLRAKPPLDEQALAERKAAREARDAAAEGKRAAKKAAEDDRRSREAAEREARAAAAAAAPAPKTEAELKAARDARYAARKKRK